MSKKLMPAQIKQQIKMIVGFPLGSYGLYQIIAALMTYTPHNMRQTVLGCLSGLCLLGLTYLITKKIEQKLIPIPVKDK